MTRLAYLLGDLPVELLGRMCCPAFRMPMGGSLWMSMWAAWEAPLGGSRRGFVGEVSVVVGEVPGIWGYAPLIVTLANTREVLYLVNRPGNAPSRADAAAWIDKAIDLVELHAPRVCLRGDTDFS